MDGALVALTVKMSRAYRGRSTTTRKGKPMSKPTVSELEKQLDAARQVIKPAGLPELIGAKVKSARMYHSSVTRHNSMVFVLEDGSEVFKSLRETDDFMRTAFVFSNAADVTVWYDKNKQVQQFVLSQNYG